MDRKTLISLTKLQSCYQKQGRDRGWSTSWRVNTHITTNHDYSSRCGKKTSSQHWWLRFSEKGFPVWLHQAVKMAGDEWELDLTWTMKWTPNPVNSTGYRKYTTLNSSCGVCISGYSAYKVKQYLSLNYGLPRLRTSHVAKSWIKIAVIINASYDTFFQKIGTR